MSDYFTTLPGEGIASGSGSGGANPLANEPTLRTHASSPGEPPCPAVEPERVLSLNDAEQRLLIEVLCDACTRANDAGEDPARPFALLNRLEHGDAYMNPADELVRMTLRKRRLEAEVRRCGQRIEAVEPLVVEQWADAGRTGEKHEATGARLIFSRKLWAKLIVPSGLDSESAAIARADAKAEAGAALEAAGLGHLVRADFNLNTLSALFRERVREHDLMQRDLPEHERVPLDVASLLPDELQGVIRLDAEPHIQVRSS